MATEGGFLSKVRKAEPDLPLLTLAVLLILIASIAWIFGYEHPPLSPSLLLEVLLAAMLLGGLGGFLFGLPKLEYAGSARPVVAGSPATTPAATVPASPSATKSASGSYAPGTNLDEVANWLTKIIIGATLVEIKDIGKAIKDISAFIVAPCTPGCGVFAQPFVAAIIVAAFIAGFLFGYLWTRLHYGGIAAAADQKVIQIVSKETGQVTEVVAEKKVTASIAMASPPAVNVNNRWVTDPGSSDPNKGQFGGSANVNGRELSARFSASNLPGFTQVELFVRGIAPRALNGVVTFHLHPTFKLPIVDVPVIDGVATLSFLAWGAFTVGAVADMGNTRLELDLAQQMEAPEEFRKR